MTERIVVPFRRWHYEWLLESASAEAGGFRPTAEQLRLIELQNSWTGVVDGEPIVCAGTLQHWPRRHQAWAYVKLGSRRHLPWITEEVLKNLAAVQGRIEFTVRADFLPGQRWAKRLGFEVETPLLRSYGPQGEDHVGFVRVN